MQTAKGISDSRLWEASHADPEVSVISRYPERIRYQSGTKRFPTRLFHRSRIPQKDLSQCQIGLLHPRETEHLYRMPGIHPHKVGESTICFRKKRNSRSPIASRFNPIYSPSMPWMSWRPCFLKSRTASAKIPPEGNLSVRFLNGLER